MAELTFDGQLHEGKRGASYQDFRTLEDALDFVRDLPRRARTYISSYGRLNPDSGSDEEGTDKAWRSLSQLALTDRFSNAKFVAGIHSEADRIFEVAEGFRVNVRGI